MHGCHLGSVGGEPVLPSSSRKEKNESKLEIERERCMQVKAAMNHKVGKEREGGSE